MFFDVPDWKVGRPVSEEEALAARKLEAKKLRGNRPSKNVSFAEAREGRAQARPQGKRVPRPAPEKAAPQPDRAVSGLAKVSKPADTIESKLKAKLSGSRFRFLNQKLYESDSKTALAYFQENQDDFFRYHEGFQEQTKKWPTNPVNVFIDRICGLLKSKKAGKLVIADLGCGEGRLGLDVARMAKEMERPGVLVHSFDLVACGDHVKAASMTAVPLATGSVDLVIFSLALMNTDFCKALKEANRLLRAGGEVWIAEVESRFDGGTAGIDAFVQKLKPLGFQLQGRVDQSHKVFVLMKFAKTHDSAGHASSVSLKACKYKKR